MATDGDGKMLAPAVEQANLMMHWEGLELWLEHKRVGSQGLLEMQCKSATQRLYQSSDAGNGDAMLCQAEKEEVMLRI